MSKLDRLQQLETMYEGFVTRCGERPCQQCQNALASIRRQIQEEQSNDK